MRENPLLINIRKKQPEKPFDSNLISNFKDLIESIINPNKLLLSQIPDLIKKIKNIQETAFQLLIKSGDRKLKNIVKSEVKVGNLLNELAILEQKISSISKVINNGYKGEDINDLKDKLETFNRSIRISKNWLDETKQKYGEIKCHSLKL